MQVVNSRVAPLSHTEGAPPETVGSFISLTDADSANSAVSVDEVVISVESEEELLNLQETDSNITVVGAKPFYYFPLGAHLKIAACIIGYNALD